MMSRHYKDIVAGGLLVVLGLFVAGQAIYSFSLGTVSHMGPGMFPAVLGVILAGLGTLVLVAGLVHSDPLPRPDIRPLFAVLIGILLFAATIDFFGMVPAIFLVTLAAALADNRLGIVQTILLAIGLSVISVLIFRVGLEVPLDIARWPFE